MSLSTEIERIVTNYFSCGIKSHKQDLISDLSRLMEREPSRTELTDLLHKFAAYIRRPAGDWRTIVWEDSFMSWAKSEPSKRWCSHLKSIKDHWIHVTPNEFEVEADTWDICPVAGCHAPRPS